MRRQNTLSATLGTANPVLYCTPVPHENADGCTVTANIRMPIILGFATTVLGWFCDPGFGLRFATPAVNRQPTLNDEAKNPLDAIERILDQYN